MNKRARSLFPPGAVLSRVARTLCLLAGFAAEGPELDIRDYTERTAYYHDSHEASKDLRRVRVLMHEAYDRDVGDTEVHAATWHANAGRLRITAGKVHFEPVTKRATEYRKAVSAVLEEALRYRNEGLTGGITRRDNVGTSNHTKDPP